MNKLKLGLGVFALGIAASLTGCATLTVPDRIKQHKNICKIQVSYYSEGYNVICLNKMNELNAIYSYNKNLNESYLWRSRVIDIYNVSGDEIVLKDYQRLKDKGVDEIVDEIESVEYGFMKRGDKPHYLFENADKTLEKYKKLLNIEKVHKTWKNRVPF